MYKRFVYKYIIAQIIADIIIVAFAVRYDIGVFIAAAIPYFVFQTVINFLIRAELKKKADVCLKEKFPVLWERYTGNTSPFHQQFGFSIKHTMGPHPAAEYLAWDKKMEFEYRTDADIIDIKKDIAMMYISIFVAFLPVLLFAGMILLWIVYALAEYIGRQIHF